MRGAKRIVFVVGATLAAIPAILGAFVGVIGICAIVAAATVVCAVLGLAIAICCVPIIVWCALFESSNFEFAKRTKAAVPELN